MIFFKNNTYCKIKTLANLVILLAIILSPLSILAKPTLISIKQDTKNKENLIFVGFENLDPATNQQVENIFRQIIYNLGSTNLFSFSNYQQSSEKSPLDFIEDVSLSVKNAISTQFINVETMPKFDNLSKANINSLIVVEAKNNEKGILEIKLRLWDVLDQKQVIGKFYSAPISSHKKMSNIIANDIYKALTGEQSGHFDSKIAYISETGSAKNRTKRISIIDFDGKNRHILTSGSDLVLTPNFTFDASQIFYLRYHDYRPQVFRINLGNLLNEKIGGFAGTTFAAYPHPTNSNIVLLSVILEENSDIYELNISKNTARRLTTHPSIDTTPSFSPDGKTIAFSSDRDGGQQIYLINSDGGNLRRISYGGGSYSKPIWSPDGKMIAFTKVKNNQFSIGVMFSDGKNEKTVTSAHVVEGAKWSPNGRYLIYSKKLEQFGFNSIPKLYIIDIVTGHEFKINTPENEGATDPDWH